MVIHVQVGPANTSRAHADQRGVEAREDVLVYSTAPMAADMEVTGPITLELWAKSSAADTDFTAKLIDVSPPSMDYPTASR